MLIVDHTSFDNLTMRARAVDKIGRPVRVSFVYTIDGGLSCCNVTNGKWLCNDEWDWG